MYKSPLDDIEVCESSMEVSNSQGSIGRSVYRSLPAIPEVYDCQLVLNLCYQHRPVDPIYPVADRFANLVGDLTT